jgi:hypothetical protein
VHDSDKSPFWIHTPSGQPPQSRGRSTDRAVRGDAAFFKRHPHRRHRIRLASRDERARALPELGSLPRDREIYTAVRNVADGARIRVYYVAGAGSETDVDEILAQAAFELAAPASAELHETIFRKVLAGQPGAPAPFPIAPLVPPAAEAWQGAIPVLPVMTIVTGNDGYVGSFWAHDQAELAERWIPAESSEDGAAADREFFERHPHRQYRVRLASQFERQPFAGPVPHGREMYAVVDNGRDRMRVRLFLAAPTARWEEVGEAEARAAFKAAAPPGWPGFVAGAPGRPR